MDYALPPDVVDLQARTRAIVDEHLIPNELTLSKSYKLPPGEKQRLEAIAAAAGLRLLNVPREFGGQERGFLARIAVAAELGRTIALPARGGSILGPEVSPILYHLTGPRRKADGVCANGTGCRQRPGAHEHDGRARRR